MRKRYAVISILLILFAMGFLIYALGHPTASFPWSNTVTYGIYAGYGILTGIMCGLALRKGR